MAQLRIVIYLTIIFISYGSLAQHSGSNSEFSEWASEYETVYTSWKEVLEREDIFYQNVEEIKRMNDQYRGQTEFKINQFADLTTIEFKESVLMPRRKSVMFPPERYLKSRQVASLPASFDWTSKGKVTSVKNQGSVGTCWAFSAVGNLEGQWAMQGKRLANFSVEQIVDCDSGTKAPKADCGVFGGWPFLAYQYVERAGGIESWTDYAYCVGIGGPDNCFPCQAPGYNKTLCGPPVTYCLRNESCAAKLDRKKFFPGVRVADWKAISRNETEMAVELMQYGPLSVALDASKLQFYHHGVFNPISCSKTELDHAVLVVGFGSAKETFKTHPYWKVKNSWGAKWGEKGYFRIQRGEGTCGVNTQVTTALLVKS